MTSVSVSALVLLASLPVMSSAFLLESSGYKAAVYAHRPILPSIIPVPRSTAVRNMMKNVNIYKQQARMAASQGAQIIVFPEDGLYGFDLSRRVIRTYLEPIPDPRTSAAWIPCSDPGRVTPSDILTQLSCMASENRIYVVANMGDIQPCDNTTNDVVCPPDGHYQYNTDVVFDPTGLLIARYHKRTLFGESQFDTPPAERITFDTPFGRFGVFTCFDVLFYDPAVMLVEQGVQNIAFPTAWIDAFPMLDAVGFHSAWARRQGVNFLAANIQIPEFRFVGSGIYSASGALDFYYNRNVGSRGRLVVADVPSSQRLRREDNEIVELSDTSFNRPHPGLFNMERMLFPAASPAPFQVTINHDVFEMVEVNDPSGTVSVCKGRTCCTLTYSRSGGYQGMSNPDYFAFGASEGIHDSMQDWYFEACVLVRCTDRSHDSCGSLTWDSHTIFSSIVISGNFTTQYMYPEVLVSSNGQVALTPPNQWQFSADGTLTATRLTQPLLMAGLYARDYTKDPPLIARSG